MADPEYQKDGLLNYIPHLDVVYNEMLSVKCDCNRLSGLGSC